MADFALWATACETALWPVGTFWSAYCGNRDEAVEGVIDADPIAAACVRLWRRRPSGREPPWTFWTPWPRWLVSASPNPRPGRIARRALAGQAAPGGNVLRKVGIEIGFVREGLARTRTINITTSTRPKTPGRNRPHRPHHPRPSRIPTRPMGSRGATTGRTTSISPAGSDDRVTLRHQANAGAELERARRRRGKRERDGRIVSVRIALGQLTAAWIRRAPADRGRPGWRGPRLHRCGGRSSGLLTSRESESASDNAFRAIVISSRRRGESVR